MFVYHFLLFVSFFIPGLLGAFHYRYCLLLLLWPSMSPPVRSSWEPLFSVQCWPGKTYDSQCHTAHANSGIFFWKLRQEDKDLRSAWAMRRPCLKASKQTSTTHKSNFSTVRFVQNGFLMTKELLKASLNYNWDCVSQCWQSEQHIRNCQCLREQRVV